MSSTQSRSRAPRKPPAERAEDIAAAARELALEQGLSSLTLRSVAVRAGVGHALVAHYVSSMDSLIAETYSSIVEAEITELETVIAALATPSSRLAALITTLLDGTRDDITGVWVEGWTLGRRNETLAEAVRGQMDAWQEVFSTVIEHGVAAGEFRVTDPAAVAWHLLGMVDGLNAQSLVRRDYKNQRGELICSVAEGMLAVEPGALTASLRQVTP